MDAFRARDIQELFRLEKRQSFQRFVELLLMTSGGIFVATRYAGDCEVGRTAISNYLGVLEATFVAHVVRPFHSSRATEIVAAPKTYGFDTGFVTHYRGWRELRPEDHGNLWEHLVLNEIHAARQARDTHYWHDKQDLEIDFILPGRRGAPLAIKCKWKEAAFDPSKLTLFRKWYPIRVNLVVASDVDRPHVKTHGGIKARYVGPGSLIAALDERPDHDTRGQH